MLQVGSILEPTWPYFGRVVGAKLGPTWAQVAPKPHLKSDQKNDYLLDLLWDDFWCILAPKLGGKLGRSWH